MILLSSHFPTASDELTSKHKVVLIQFQIACTRNCTIGLFVQMIVQWCVVNYKWHGKFSCYVILSHTLGVTIEPSQYATDYIAGLNSGTLSRLAFKWVSYQKRLQCKFIGSLFNLSNFKRMMLEMRPLILWISSWKKLAKYNFPWLTNSRSLLNPMRAETKPC